MEKYSYYNLLVWHCCHFLFLPLHFGTDMVSGQYANAYACRDVYSVRTVYRSVGTQTVRRWFCRCASESTGEISCQFCSHIDDTGAA